MQQLRLVALTEPAQQEPADKAGDEPSATRGLRCRKAGGRQRHDRDFHPVLADPAADLLTQYGCGPICFSGDPDDLYERHLIFDDVVAPTAAGPRAL